MATGIAVTGIGATVGIVKGAEYLEHEAAEHQKNYTKITWIDDTTFEGEYVDGKVNGHGKVTTPDGSKFEGEFKDGRLRNADGSIRVLIEMGDGAKGSGIYIGRFDDRKNGRGIFKSNGVKDLRAEGNFVNGKLEGEGKTIETGETYAETCEGTFKDGKLNGQGTKHNTVSGKWTGQFKDGKLCDPQGVYVWESETRKGEFKDDELNGEGEITHLNGSSQKGIFVNGKLQDGHALQVKPNGIVIETYVKNGRANGPGSVINSPFSGEATWNFDGKWGSSDD